MIGVLVADVTDPTVAEFVCGAESAAAEANYTMLLSRCQVLEQGQTHTLDHLLGNVDGVVVANPRIADPVIAAIGERWPVVTLERVAAGVPSVLANHSQGAHLAAEHLSSLSPKHQLRRRAGEVVGRRVAVARAAERGRRSAPARPPARTVHAHRGWWV